MAYLEVTGVTTTSISVRIAGLDPDYWVNYGTSNLPRHTMYEIIMDLFTGSRQYPGKGSISGTSAICTFGGLPPNTAHTFTGLIDYLTPTGDAQSTSTDTIIVATAKVLPAKFHWYNNTNIQIVDHGGIYRFPKDEWNRLMDKIGEIQVYVTGLADTQPLRRSPGDKLNDADLYNEVVNKLKAINSSAPVSTVTRYISHMTPARLEALRTAVNYIIDHL
jgi:hypothetical protein